VKNSLFEGIPFLAKDFKEETMSKLEVNKLVLGKAYEFNLGLDENILFLTPDLPVEEDDIQVLSMWKIKTLELLDKKAEEIEQSTADTFEHYEM
jgi:hypothetical protein